MISVVIRLARRGSASGDLSCPTLRTPPDLAAVSPDEALPLLLLLVLVVAVALPVGVCVVEGVEAP